MTSEEIEENAPTFDVSGQGPYSHRVGDGDCAEGWCGNNYPARCDCGGLLHADFGDENYDGDYWLYTKCGRCGESE